MILRAVVFLGLLSVATGCTPGGVRTTSTVSKDVARFAELAHLPVRVQEVTFELTQHGDGFLGPSDFGVTAVMRVNEDDVPTLLADFEPVGSDLGLPERPWLLEALQGRGSETGGGRLVIRGQAFKGRGGWTGLTRVGETSWFIFTSMTH